MTESNGLDLYTMIEKLMENTILKVDRMDNRLERHGVILEQMPDMRSLLATQVNNHTILANAAQQMANTLEKFQDRQETLEKRNEEVSDRAAGKDQIPLKSHYWTLVAALLPTFVMSLGVVSYVLYSTNRDIKASLTTLEINQHRTQEIVKQSTEKVEEKIEQVELGDTRDKRNKNETE